MINYMLDSRLYVYHVYDDRWINAHGINRNSLNLKNAGVLLDKHEQGFCNQSLLKDIECEANV